MALTKDFCLKLFPSPFKLTQFHNKHCLKPLLVPGTMPSIANQGSTAPKGASSLMAKTISGTWRVRLMTSLEAEEWLPFPSVHQIPGEQNREGHLGQEGHMHKSGGGKEPSWWPVRVELRVQEQSKQAEARLHRGGPVGCDSANDGPWATCENHDSKGSWYFLCLPQNRLSHMPICPSPRPWKSVQCPTVLQETHTSAATVTVISFTCTWTSSKWNHPIWTLLSLASLAHCVCEIHPWVESF